MAAGRPTLAVCASALAALVALGVAPLSARAAAEPDIPPECGSRAAFDSELASRLGEHAPLEGVHVAITPRANGFHLRVQIGSEVRELEDESCRELFRAAVVVAVAVLMRDRTPREAAPEAAPAPPRSPATSQGPHFAFSTGAGISVGILPPPVFSAELETKLLWHRWGGRLGLRYLAPGETSDAQARGVRLQGLGVGASAIFRPAHAWEARLGFALQYLTGKGQRVAQPLQGAAWAGGPTLGLEYTPLELPPFWLGLGAEGQLNLLRGHFEIRKYSGDVYDVPWLGGSAFVRLGLAW